MPSENMHCHSKHNQFGSKHNQFGSEHNQIWSKCNNYCKGSSLNTDNSKSNDCNVLSSNIEVMITTFYQSKQAILLGKEKNNIWAFNRDSKSILEQFCLNCVLFYAYYAPRPSQLCFGTCICGTQRCCIVKWRFCELSQTAI